MIHERPLTSNIDNNYPPLSLKEYEQKGGYAAIHKVLKGMTPVDVQKLVQDSRLQGRGGAGFNTGMKWSFVPMGSDAPHPKYLICNADEMEPGTFKDRLLLEGNPHQMIEGMILAAYAIQADISYIFLRWAYKEAAQFSVLQSLPLFCTAPNSVRDRWLVFRFRSIAFFGLSLLREEKLLQDYYNPLVVTCHYRFIYHFFGS